MTSIASFAGHCKVVHVPDVLIDSGFETACARPERRAHSATRSHQRGAFANANAARHVRAKCAGAGCIRWSLSQWPGPAARGMRLHGKRRARRPGSSPSRAWAHVRLVLRLVCRSTACGGCTGRMCCVLERRGVSVCKQESVWGWLLININGVCVNWSEKCRMQIRAMMEPWGSVWAMASPALCAGVH